MKEKKQMWVIITIVFLGFIGISMPYLIFPALFLNPTYSIIPAGFSESGKAIFLGITLAVYPLGQFIGSPILGSMSDDYGRKRLLSTSLLITAIANLLTGAAIVWQQMGLLIFSRFAAGLMEGNISIARAMATDLTTISKHEAFGKINAAASIAYLIGPLFGGLLSDKDICESLTASTPFYLTCILFAGLSALSAIILESDTLIKKSKIQTIWQRLNLFKRIAQLLSNKRLKLLLIISTCFTLAIDIFYEFGPVYLTMKWTLSPAQLIFYNGVLCLTSTIGNLWMKAFIASPTLIRPAIIYSIGGFALFLTGMVLTDSTFLMMLLFAVSGFAIGLGVTLLTVKISDSASDSIQGEVMGTLTSLRVLADAVICLFGGFLLILSPKIILMIAAVISLAAMSYYARAFNKTLPKT